LSPSRWRANSVAGALDPGDELEAVLPATSTAPSIGIAAWEHREGQSTVALSLADAGRLVWRHEWRKGMTFNTLGLLANQEA
jgi:hypothetical protein